MAEERLQKIISRAGIASRRAAEALILEGRVQVNGEIVRELGTKADASKDVIRIDDAVIAEPEELVHYVMYKPERVVTTLDDPEGRSSVGEMLQRAKLKIYPVGRLDYDAEGTLLLTNDGDLAHKLTHPRWGVRRTYLAKVRGEPSAAALQRLRDGVRLEDGMAQAQDVSFERQTPRNTWIRLVLTEGRHHLVKRLCEAIGHPVVRLFRSDYGGVGVGGMKPGEIRRLTAAELQALRAAVAKEAPLPPGGRPRRRSARRAAAVHDPIYGTPRRGVEGGEQGSRPPRRPSGNFRGGPGGPRGGGGPSGPSGGFRGGPGGLRGGGGPSGPGGGFRGGPGGPRGGGPSGPSGGFRGGPGGPRGGGPSGPSGGFRGGPGGPRGGGGPSGPSGGFRGDPGGPRGGGGPSGPGGGFRGGPGGPRGGGGPSGPGGGFRGGPGGPRGAGGPSGPGGGFRSGPGGPRGAGGGPSGPGGGSRGASAGASRGRPAGGGQGTRGPGASAPPRRGVGRAAGAGRGAGRAGGPGRGGKGSGPRRG